MNELEYAEMLEIPVSTVNVVKKKSLFRRRPKEERSDDLKEKVVESVNERVGAYVATEDLSDPPAPPKRKFSERGKRDRASIILLTEAIAVGVIAVAIFLTNVFMPNSVINTFLGNVTGAEKKIEEPGYAEFTLSPIVGESFQDDVAVSESGVMSFTGACSVYPVCDGKISLVREGDDGLYSVEISHTSAFTSVITGLSEVYYELGTKVFATLPVGYTDGTAEVQVTMYDNGNLLNGFTLNDAVPVWNR